MDFRHAVPEEAELILTLYKSVLNTPFCVWDEYYPSAEDIADDLAHDDLFVLTDDGNEIVGAISIVPRDETGELTFWTETDAAAEFARVVIRPDRQGCGLARMLVAGVEDVLRRRGIRWVRLLTAVVNTPACRTYLGCGYRIAGECDMYGHHYYACEKQL